MKQFRTDNIGGYTQEQLDEFNRRHDMAVAEYEMNVEILKTKIQEDAR